MSTDAMNEPGAPRTVEEQSMDLLRVTFTMLDTMSIATNISASECAAYTEAARWVARRIVRKEQEGMRMITRVEQP